MQNDYASSSLSSGQQLDNANTSGYNVNLSKLGKFLGFRAASTGNRFETFSFCSNPSSPFVVRSINEVLIADLKSHSLASEDVKSPPLKVSLRVHSLPTSLNEEVGSVTVLDSKPNSRRRWNWNLLKGNKSQRFFPILRRTPPAASQSESATSPLEATFVPTPPLSTIFSADTHDPLMSDSSDLSDDMDFLKPSRRKSINKLARTLGVAPHDFEPSNDPHLAVSFGPDSTRSRSMSLPLNTISTGIPPVLQPSTRPQLDSRSRISLSTSNIDDLHRLNLADNLSDNRGEIRSGSRTSISSHSPISPIIFNPPTPITTQPPPPLPSIGNMKLEEKSLTSSLHSHVHTTLKRSRSMTLAPLKSKLGRLVAGAHTVESTPDIPPLPVKANWLESTREEVSKARNFVVAHPEYMDEYSNWSGQWNQDNMHDVIKMLRTLK
ncbi:hypothetical protein C0995_007721 [Termitomyces sp. Mi166|nr:hypothetical protein C0995_007721 [Termitomyces sp. Mi166\